MSFHPDAFYSWAAVNNRGAGSCGVTGKFERAAALLYKALAELAPGAVGRLTVVRLDVHRWPPSYIYDAHLLDSGRKAADA